MFGEAKALSGPVVCSVASSGLLSSSIIICLRSTAESVTFLRAEVTHRCKHEIEKGFVQFDLRRKK